MCVQTTRGSGGFRCLFFMPFVCWKMKNCNTWAMISKAAQVGTTCVPNRGGNSGIFMGFATCDTYWLVKRRIARRKRLGEPDNQLIRNF